jgi:glycosyltransferase involved in cell wall biosynthesis
MTTKAPEPRKPRLLVVTSTYPRWADDHEPGFVHALVRGMLESFDVLVVCPHAPGSDPDGLLDGAMVKRYRYAPARFETLVNDGGIMANLKRSRWKWLLLPGFMVSQIATIWRLHRKWQPDAIHAHWLVPAGLAAKVAMAMSKTGTPLLVTSHGTDLNSLRGKGMVALKRFVANGATAMTVVSTPMRGELERIGVDPSKVDVIPMGVDLQARFTPDPTAARSHDELLFVGRLTETKGLRHLLDAMPAVLAGHPATHLTIVGFGPELDERRSQAKALGIAHRVCFEGAVAQPALPALYRRAAALVAPFEEARSGAREGLGLVMVEAIGCGCPVVTTRQPATNEVFGAVGPAGMAEPGSSASLAAAIVDVLREPEGARDAATRARAQLVQRFDMASVSRRYSTLLMDLARGGFRGASR